MGLSVSRRILERATTFRPMELDALTQVIEGMASASARDSRRAM